MRAGNIFKKLEERGLSANVSADALAKAEAGQGLRSLGEGGWEDDLWALVLDAASTREVVERAVQSLELSTLARHAFSLAQAFNHFYHRHPIASEEDPALRNRRLAVARIFAREMAGLLDLLGIPEPGRM